MKLIIDANISKRLTEHLRQTGMDVLSVLETKPNASDDYILRLAIKEKRVIITYDLDFGRLVFSSVMSHHGVILLRASDLNWQAQLELLLDLFKKYSKEEITRNFWVITSKGIRKHI